MKQGEWEVLRIRENGPIIPNLFLGSLLFVAQGWSLDSSSQTKWWKFTLGSSVRYLQGRVNTLWTESVLHAVQTSRWGNHWKWTCAVIRKQKQDYGKGKGRPWKEPRKLSRLLWTDLACSLLGHNEFILSSLSSIMPLFMPSRTWFICRPPLLRTSTLVKHKCIKTTQINSKMNILQLTPV